MSVNNMYRKVGDYYYNTEWQCLSCKAGFSTSENCDIGKYCPNCAVELKKEFTKKNKRYLCNTFYKLPIITVHYEHEYWNRFDKNSFNVRQDNDVELVKEWKVYSNHYTSNNIKTLVNIVKQAKSGSANIKLTVKRNGEEKELSVKLKPWTYTTPPKPNPYGISCSGLL